MTATAILAPDAVASDATTPIAAPPKRRSPRLAVQIGLVTCVAVVVAVLLAGTVGLGLVRHAYDGPARKILHREALLVASTAERTGSTASTRPTRPVGRVLAQGGIRVVRVHADGSIQGPAIAPAADTAAAAAGQSLSAIGHIDGHRYFVDVEPVSGDGGVILLQQASDTSAVTDTVVRRFGWALLVGLLVAIGLGVLLARRIARPLVRAAGAAHRLAWGERDLRLPADGPEEVVHVSESLNRLGSALQNSEGRQREFLMTVSHELRSPLTAIRGFAEAVADGVATGPAAVEAGRTIRSEAERMQRLVSDLLDLARLGADDFRLDLAPADLSHVVAQAATAWTVQADAVGVHFAVDAPPWPVPLVTDANRVRQMIDALIENALRVTPTGAPIVLGLYVDGADAIVHVRDGGPGLTDDDLPVAFDRSVLYERYRGVRRVGTGLGLALVGALAAKLGGSASAGHAPEGGAAFTIRLPGVGIVR